MTVKSSYKDKNCVVKPKGTASVQHSKLNENSELICVKCNGCMLFDNHDLCVLIDVNAHAKSKSIKKNSKRKFWKRTRKVFTNIGYIWRPTDQTFTIVGNVYLLTRITTTTEVPTRKPITLVTDTPKLVVTLVYSRKPRKSKSTDLVSKSKVVQIVLRYLDSGCSKHMTRDRSQLTNFVNKFLGTVKFRNDRMAKIMGYGDYHIRNVTILRVYYVEVPGHNLFSVGQFCDLNLEVAFCQHTYFICNLEGVDLLTRSQGNNLYTLSLGEIMVGISDKTFVACSPQQNGVVERRNCTLIEAAHTMLIYANAPLFLLTEAVATACYTQNRSMLRLRYEKTSYELLHNKPPYLSFLHVFSALCYLTNDSENLDFDELTAMASEHSSSGPALHEMTLATITLGLVPNLPSSTSYVPPSRSDWDILFEPLFDELLNPPPSVDFSSPEVIAPITEVVAPEPLHQPVHLPQLLRVTKNTNFRDDPLHKDSTSQGSSSNIRKTHTPFESLGRWTKDHHIANVIGDPSRFVLTRKQLQTDAMWCFFDPFLTTLEPKNFKQAMIEPSWIDAMQEEIHEFEML
nr:putative ribonuclease H-like domain-containing protein [Tanacetum cinerariifolium]